MVIAHAGPSPIPGFLASDKSSINVQTRHQRQCRFHSIISPGLRQIGPDTDLTASELAWIMPGSIPRQRADRNSKQAFLMPHA
jgi:hypothetical protein